MLTYVELIYTSTMSVHVIELDPSLATVLPPKPLEKAGKCKTIKPREAFFYRMAALRLKAASGNAVVV